MLADRRTTPGNITMLDTTILFHAYRGISINMARVIDRVSRNFANDPKKQSLGVGRFITRVANYVEIDLAGVDLTEISPSTIPTNLTKRVGTFSNSKIRPNRISRASRVSSHQLHPHSSLEMHSRDIL